MFLTSISGVFFVGHIRMVYKSNNADCGLGFQVITTLCVCVCVCNFLLIRKINLNYVENKLFIKLQSCAFNTYVY